MAGPTPLGEPGYHPPSFPLFEAVLADGMAQPHRWLLGWNGLVTEPATDVTLAARSADEVALVTSSRWSSELDARLAASSLVAALHPATNGFTPAALRTFAQDDSSWTEAQVRVDGHARRGATATLRGGHGRLLRRRRICRRRRLTCDRIAAASEARRCRCLRREPLHLSRLRRAPGGAAPALTAATALFRHPALPEPVQPPPRRLFWFANDTGAA